MAILPRMRAERQRVCVGLQLDYNSIKMWFNKRLDMLVYPARASVRALARALVKKTKLMTQSR